jgi:DNA-binding MarR family transcriptional regulator
VNARSNAAVRRYEVLLKLLRTSETIWNASRLFFARWELSASQFNVLNLLRLHGGGLSQTELSRELITHRSNVTGLVDRLEKRKLLVRKPVTGDRRSYSVQLTGAGTELVATILPEYHARAAELLAAVPVSRLAAFELNLERVRKAAGRISGLLESERNS